MSSLISKAEFVQTISTITHEWYAIIDASGIQAFTCILECFDVNNNPVNFPPDQKYSILVSNDAWDTHYDLYDYYHVMILENPYDGWIKIRDISLPQDVRCVNGFSVEEYGDNISNPLHWRYIMVRTPELANKKVRITVGLK
jgi:hypothetical protein